MSKVTTASVNKALKLLGVDERLHNAGSYFYFYGGNSDSWYSASVIVSSADCLTVEQWIEEYKTLSKESSDA